MSLDYDKIARALGGTLHDMGSTPPFGVTIGGLGASLSGATACMLRLPYPPTLNHMFATVRGRRVLSKAGRTYRQRVAAVCIGVRPLDGDVTVRLKVWRPRRSGDLDNTFKAVFDSLRGIAFHDDSQVVCIEAHRMDDKADPRVEVLVSRVDADSANARGAMPAAGAVGTRAGERGTP